MPLRFDVLFRDAPNAYMVLDRDFRYLEANRAYELLTGVAREDLLGRNLFDLFPGTTNPDGTDQGGMLRASFERVLATGKRDVLALIPYAIERRTADGTVVDMRYWSATHTPVHDEAGAVIGILQHTTDVTETQRLREELRRARADSGATDDQLSSGVLMRAAEVQRAHDALLARVDFLQDLFEQAPGFVAVMRGPDYVFEMANTAFERISRRTGIVGRTMREVFPELEAQGFLALLDQVRQTGNPFLARGMSASLADPDGTERTVYTDFVYQPVRGADGTVEAIFLQGVDVTDREGALAALRQSEARFRTIADMLPQMIWSTLPDGFHDYYNRRWYEFTGVPEGSTDGEAWNGMFHPDDQERAWARWRHSLATGKPYEIEYRLRDRHGDYQWVLGRALPVRDAEGQITRWMGTCTEIHELKRVQQELEQSQAALRLADQNKDQFLAVLAHELRNPLAPVSNAAQLLKLAPGNVESVRRAGGIIERQAAHMRDLVEDLIDVSRVTRGLVSLQKKPVRLADLVEAAVEQATPLVEQRGHRLEVTNQAPDLEMRVDPTRVTQVLANLLNNAAKYTPPGGFIALDVARDGGDAVVSVRDTGVGMDATLLARVFELFTQAENTPERREGGLGVGLSLARSLAQMHGGQLTANSPGRGQGATFELRLPIDAGAGAA